MTPTKGFCSSVLVFLHATFCKPEFRSCSKEEAPLREQSKVYLKPSSCTISQDILLKPNGLKYLRRIWTTYINAWASAPTCMTWIFQILVNTRNPRFSTLDYLWQHIKHWMGRQGRNRVWLIWLLKFSSLITCMKSILYIYWTALWIYHAILTNK